MEKSLTEDGGAGTDITEYEQERNQRKKTLHDEVERTLLAARFADAASFRVLLSGETTANAGDGDVPAKKRRRRKEAAAPGALVLRRTSSRFKESKQTGRSATSTSAAAIKVSESFCTWTPKRAKKNMTSKKTTTKRKPSQSPDPDVEGTEEEYEGRSPSPTHFKEKGAPQDMHPPFSEEVQGLQEPRWMQGTVGFPRPQHGGYRGTESGRRPSKEWGDESRFPYGSHSAAQGSGSFRRAWSPTPYEDGRDFEGRGRSYGGRGRDFDMRSDYVDRRDFYYEGRGRDYDMRDGELEEHRRYEDRRYGGRPPLTGDGFGRGLPASPAPNFQGHSSRIPSSPPPSSLRNATETAILETEGPRALLLDKMGVPTGKMAPLFHAEIVKFAKDMYPVEGWEGQTAAAKDRLRERLMHDYHYYGESTRLSERYLKKKTGAALTQFCYNINLMIDAKADRPSDIHPDIWDEMVKRRATEESKEKSEQMARIARGRSSKNTTKKALEQRVILQLARELKREPYDAEIKQAVETGWAEVQEEAANRKRQRASTTASKAALQSNKDLEKRLLLVEAFMQKWEPKMELWKGSLVDAQAKDGLNSIAHKTANSKELSVIPIVGNAGRGASEDKSGDSSDDAEENEKSESSAHEEAESESEDEEQSSADEIEKVENFKPVSVVEPDLAIVSPHKPKKNTPIVPAGAMPGATSSAAPPKPRVPRKSGTRSSSMSEMKLGGNGDGPLEKGAVPESVDVVAKENEDAVQEPVSAAQELEKESRPRKKSKASASSTQKQGTVDEETVTNVAREVDEPAKTFKTPRRVAKSANAKTDTKGGKKGK